MKIITDNVTYKNTNNYKSPSFGLKIIKDKEFNALVNYYTPKYGQDYMDKVIKKIENLSIGEQPSDKFSIVFYPLRKRVDNNDFYIDEGIFCDKKVYGIPRLSVSYEFFPSNQKPSCNDNYFAWTESRLIPGIGGSLHKTKSNPIELYKEIKKDFTDWIDSLLE